jgi:hypothetical protein
MSPSCVLVRPHSRVWCSVSCPSSSNPWALATALVARAANPDAKTPTPLQLVRTTLLPKASPYTSPKISAKSSLSHRRSLLPPFSVSAAACSSLSPAPHTAVLPAATEAANQMMRMSCSTTWRELLLAKALRPLRRARHRSADQRRPVRNGQVRAQARARSAQDCRRFWAEREGPIRRRSGGARHSTGGLVVVLEPLSYFTIYVRLVNIFFLSPEG